MSVKRIFTALVLLVSVTAAYATRPTVTTTFSGNSLRQNIYSFSYSTGIANTDTAIIGNAVGSWIAVDGACAHPSDSLITIELKSSEATADSIRHTVLVQVTSVSSPSMTSSTTTDWITVLTDASTFTNTAVGKLVKFPKARLAGQATKMRILIFENDTNKDATQTITGRVIVPKR